MDDLLSEFLTETAESLDVVDVELVRFESNPGDKATLNNIFRLVHTIKGTCGFIGLPRLESIAHAGETLLGKFRDGALPVTPASVTLVLASVDRIKLILAHLAAEQVEPPGDDRDLIAQLERVSQGEAIALTPNRRPRRSSSLRLSSPKLPQGQKHRKAKAAGMATRAASCVRAKSHLPIWKLPS